MWKLITALVSVIFLSAGLFAAQAQVTDEQERLLERLRNAQAEVETAQQLLAQAREQTRPILEREAALQARYQELKEQLNAALDETDIAQSRVEKLPITLTARRNAVADILIRLYEQNADAERIRQRERELAELDAQIARLEAQQEGPRERAEASFQNMQRLAREKDRVDAQIQRLQIALGSAQGTLNGLERRLRVAQEELEWVRNAIRSEFGRNPPPHMSLVRVGPADNPFYEGSWSEPATETAELLKLAQYLLADLNRSIPMRQAQVDRLIEEVTRDQRIADQRLQEYVDAIGGSHDGFLGYVERGLDKMTFGYGGALITAGWLTKTKINIEILDSAVTVARDSLVGDEKGRLPLHVALIIEAGGQVFNAVFVENPKNPNWDVTKMMPPSHGGDPYSGQREQQLFASMNKDRVREGLERLYAEVGSANLQRDDFRDRLLREYGGAKLATQFSMTTVTRERPTFEALRDFEKEESLFKPIWSFATDPNGLFKTNLKEGVKKFMGRDLSIAESNFFDLIQSAVKTGLLNKVEEVRLKIWSRYLEADADVQLSVSLLRTEGRLRRMDEHLHKILTDQVIPDLTRQLEAQRPLREKQVVSRGITGRRAEIVMQFTQPVVVQSVKLGDQDLEFSGNDTEWKARIDLRDYDTDKAVLAVDAFQTAYEDRKLDDPTTISSYVTLEQRFAGYEPKVDTHHELLLRPPKGDGYAIVLDTSGSMVENNSPRFAQAKAALGELFTSGRIGEGDIVSVFGFSGCGNVPQLVDYTDDLARANEVIQGSNANGGTPLAQSIVVAAKSLRDQNFARGTLVVVTDGDDSCSGDMAGSLAEAREIVDRIRRRTVR